MRDYEADERDYMSLSDFVKNNLRPSCSPQNLQYCDENQSALIQTFLRMGLSDLESAIQDMEKHLTDKKTNLENSLKEAEEKNRRNREEIVQGRMLGVIKEFFEIQSLQQQEEDESEEDMQEETE